MLRSFARAGASAVLALFIGPALAAQVSDLPARKPGLWESTMQMGSSNKPAPRTRLCLDQATDNLLYRYGLGLSASECAHVQVQGGGSRYTIQAECKLAGHRASTQMEMTFEGHTAYRVVMQTHYSPAFNGHSEGHVEQNAKWIGACAPGQQPGDMVIDPPGIHLNVKDAIGKP